MQTQKPRIFIASAVESLNVANAINLNLDHDAEVTVWKDGFKISTDNVVSLLNRARASDFAVFVFTPDDVSTIRQQDKLTVRDNVLFELGLFVGSLGKDRCYIVKPRGEDLHIPTDLLGLEPADYQAERTDSNLAAAVNAPCTLIRSRIEELGVLSPDARTATPTRRPKYSYPVGLSGQSLLMEVLERSAFSPDGASLSYILNNERQGRFDALTAVKLERLGLIDRTVVADSQEEYYAVALTADGTDYLLEHEEDFRLSESTPPKPTSAKPAGDFGDFNDDIPF